MSESDDDCAENFELEKFRVDKVCVLLRLAMLLTDFQLLEYIGKARIGIWTETNFTINKIGSTFIFSFY